MKFRKYGLMLSIIWVLITILHAINYGVSAGIGMLLATITIIILSLEDASEVKE